MNKYSGNENSVDRDKPLGRRLLSSTSGLTVMMAALGLASAGVASATTGSGANPAPESMPSVQEAFELAKSEPTSRGTMMHKVNPSLRRKRLVPLRQIRKPGNVQLRGNLNKKVSPAVLRSINRIATEFSKIPDDAASGPFSLFIDLTLDQRLAEKAQRKMIVR